jgi:hypothetical protein
MQTKPDSSSEPRNPRPEKTTVDVQPREVRSPDLEGQDSSMDPESMTLEDWVEAEGSSRPTLPDENAEGLDEMEEEVRRQAEDLPADTPGRL